MTANSTNTFPQDALEKSVSQLTLPGAHWFIRVPLALIIANQGYLKFIDLEGGAASFGFPIWMWALAGIAEVLGAVALIVGGAVKTLNPGDGILRLLGDVVTRLGGLAIVGIVASVIWVVYWGPWEGMQFQLMLLAGGAFFALRGNRS
ncbi:MAG: DoxX family membrane protein [Pseudomonadota bacterium]